MGKETAETMWKGEASFPVVEWNNVSDEHVSCRYEPSDATRLLLSPTLIVIMHRQISAHKNQPVVL